MNKLVLFFIAVIIAAVAHACPVEVPESDVTDCSSYDQLDACAYNVVTGWYPEVDRTCTSKTIDTKHCYCLYRHKTDKKLWHCTPIFLKQHYDTEADCLASIL